MNNRRASRGIRWAFRRRVHPLAGFAARRQPAGRPRWRRPLCYNNAVNKAQAKAYRDRWHEVQVIELQEARSTSIEDRWRQLNALKLRATRLGISGGNTEDDFEGYSLWAKLKTTHAASQE